MKNTGIKATLSGVEEVSAGPQLLAIIVRADYPGGDTRSLPDDRRHTVFAGRRNV